MQEQIKIKLNNGTNPFWVESDKVAVSEGDFIVIDAGRGLEVANVIEVVKDGDVAKIEEVKIVRIATSQDQENMEKLLKRKEEVWQISKELIKKYNLNMKLVNVEFTLENKTIISYVSEERVDFRDLVKDLASSLHLRIELKQIGIRDHAKLLGGIGACGRECCCKKFLNDFDKVSIKMAKTQGLALNSTKISGTCGRLMCCLAYENDVYLELSNKSPRINSIVETPDGKGKVVYNNLLKETVTVKFESESDTKMVEYPIDKVKVE